MDTTEAAADPLLGRLLDGRYRLDALIARGGMATVYAGTDERLDRPVAVKVMRRALADDPDFVARFGREARSAARLSEPEVVSVHDQGRDEATGASYLVMEHVRGRTMRDLLDERGALRHEQALDLLEPVLRALAAAHRGGIVHRDVKPENVLLGDAGRVKVADFGLARALETSSVTVTTGLLIGTVAYLAPEQVEQGTADARSDVYATGIVLWELLTGHPPYDGETPLSVAYRHVHDDVPPVSALVTVPPALDELVVRATRRDPALRPPDAGAFLAEVRALRGALPAAGGQRPTLVVPRASSVKVPVRRRRWRPRRGLLALAVVLALGAGAGGGGWYLGSGRYTTAPAVLTQPQAAAEAALRAEGLEVRTAEPGRFDETVPAGHVLDQEPDPGDRVRKGGPVSLVLSRGPDRREVPPLAGSTQAEAGAALSALGLRVGPVVEEFSGEPVGSVLRTDPASGAALRPQALVGLVVSKGVEQLPVPRVTGRGREEAVGALEDAGFRVEVGTAFDDQVSEGVVVSQDPVTGTAGRGSVVQLVVSLGPDLVVVPDLRGLSRQEADARARAEGLDPQAFDLPDGTGSVVTQSPGAGERVRRGSRVTYYVL